MTDEMEKYGVEEEDDKVKTATEGPKKCPSCGGELRSQDVTGVTLCVSCGSKPFEAEGKTANVKPRSS